MFLTRLALALALAIPGFMLNLGSASACSRSTLGGLANAASCPELSWRYDKNSKEFIQPGRVEGLDQGIEYDYVWHSRCEVGQNCQAARTCDMRGLRYNVTAFRLLPDGTRAAGPGQDTTVCVYPGRSVPLSTVTAAAHEEIRKRITAPNVTSAPPGKTLVNIITIYSTQPQPEPRIDITTPVPGSIVATPEYRWDFGDGQTAVGPGLPYQYGDDPAQLPGKYLGPTWRTGGNKHVTLTVTWRVQFRLEGVIDVPLDPIVFTATEDKTVATARAVLVNH